MPSPGAKHTVRLYAVLPYSCTPSLYEYEYGTVLAYSYTAVYR